jgi:dynactin-5
MSSPTQAVQPGIPSTSTSIVPVLGPEFENKVYYAKEAYFETRSGNLISKRCLIKGSDHIQISGKTILQEKLIIRGDLAQISLGKYVTLLEGVILKPSYKKHNGKIKFIPMEIGDYVFIEKNTIVSAAKIGSFTRIGKDCIIGHRSIIAENVIIADGSIVPPDTIVPAYSLYGGKPSIIDR